MNNNKISDPHQQSCVTQEIKKKHMHKRTISRTSEDLIKVLNLPMCVPGLSQIVTPQQVTEQLYKQGYRGNTRSFKTLACISEEESHIRKIIELRKNLSPTSFSEPEMSSSPFSSHKSTLNTEEAKVSFNSSTTAFSMNEENSISRILFILEMTTFPNNQRVLNDIADLLEKSPEDQYSIILDEKKTIKGIYYIEASSGYMHRIISTDDLPIIIAPRRIKSFLIFDNHREVFQFSSSTKFDAVMLK